MNLLIGTSGFSYDDWRGHFYPEALPKREMLAFYARHFPAVEINATYYALPTATTFAQMLRKVPEGFSFVVKANQEMTHAGAIRPESFAQFRAALAPLLEAGSLGCVLAQFPWSFKYGEEQRQFLRSFKEQMGDLETVIEFRNAEWVRRETIDLLRELRFGFCCVDEPRLKGLMPPVVGTTSSIGYVRFHGRNAAKWWKHEHAYERYDYLYAEEELAEWVPRIERLASETDRAYLFFNNHYQGKAGQNARMLARLLNLALPFVPEASSS